MTRCSTNRTSLEPTRYPIMDRQVPGTFNMTYLLLILQGSPRGIHLVYSMKLLLTLTMSALPWLQKRCARSGIMRVRAHIMHLCTLNGTGLCRHSSLKSLPACAQIIPKSDIAAQRRASNHLYNIEKWRQPAGTTAGKRPHFKPCEIHHVDVLAWLRRLRVAPSRTSPISTMHSRRHAFAQIAIHNHPTRRDFISARQAGTSSQRIYPAVAGPGMKPISSVGHG